MAHGLLEAQRMGPIPTPRIPDPNQEDQNVLPYSDFIRKADGPVDPLSGPTTPDDISGLVQSSNEILAVMKKIMIATRASKPNAPLAILGNPNIGANAGEFYNFEMDGRPIPALALFIINNSGHTIFIGLDDPPGTEGIPLISTAGQNILQFGIAAVNRVGIFCTNASVVNGLVNTNIKSTSGIGIYAWGNSEYANIWGMAS